MLSVDEASARLATPVVDLDIGTLRDLWLLVVADAHLLPPEAAASLNSLPVISVGLAAPGTAPAFDVLVADPVHAAAIAAVVAVASTTAAAVTNLETTIEQVCVCARAPGVLTTAHVC